jgi:transposase
VWVQTFYEDQDGLHWRHAGNIPPAAKHICSPFDVDARYNIKRQTAWTGYKVHLTETCDPDEPHLITHVITTPATEQDNEVVDELHAALAEKSLSPGQHFLDQGYSDSHSLIKVAHTYGTELIMPMRSDHSWQKQSGKGYALSDFRIDWEAQQVTCPEGKTSASWVTGQDKKGNLRHEVMFNAADCKPCSAKIWCTRSKRQRRKITFRPQEHAQFLQTVRASQETEAFWSCYATRAGIEGTISQAVVALNMRRSRYRGHPKTHLQHVATAVAINMKRMSNWWNGLPLSASRPSPFAVLMAT